MCVTYIADLSLKKPIYSVVSINIFRGATRVQFRVAV